MDSFGFNAFGSLVSSNASTSEENIKQGVATLERIKKLPQKIAVQPEAKKEPGSLLKELGFSKVADKVSEFAKIRSKENMAAVCGYTKISYEDFKKASDELTQKTRYSLQLSLTSVSTYEGVPPRYVLDEMKKAKQTDIFDSFSIIAVQKVPDPILVGQINGSKDMFFIAEWGDDISLQELVC